MTNTLPAKSIMKSLLATGFALCLTGCDLLKDLPVGKGFTAKYLCSYVFNSELDADHVTNVFIAPKVAPLPLVWKINIDYENKTVNVGDHIFLNKSLEANAFYREDIGCTLLVDKSLEEAASQIAVPFKAPPLSEDLPWPHGTSGLTPEPIPGLDLEKLNQAVDAAFEEPEKPRNTTSLLVAYNGQMIAEKYAHGVSKDTPLLGWSMTKTITGTLIGILNDQQRIQLDQPAPIPEWAGTEKENITIRDLLHMASGLQFNEDYEGFSDVSHMLYQESDQVAYAVSRPLINEPGTVFNYNTGDANILARIVQDTVGGTPQDAYDFYQTQLFHKVGVRSAFIEIDAAGQFVGGAYGFMTPRDWLRMGQLYLQKGQWNGEQVISEEWVDLVSQPSPAAEEYGGQLWLNTDGIEWPNVPHDAYLFAGHQGQRVVIIPSKNLVVVRTGVTEDYDYIGLGDAIEGVISALPE